MNIVPLEGIPSLVVLNYLQSVITWRKHELVRLWDTSAT